MLKNVIFWHDLMCLFNFNLILILWQLFQEVLIFWAYLYIHTIRSPGKSAKNHYFIYTVLPTYWFFNTIQECVRTPCDFKAKAYIFGI